MGMGLGLWLGLGLGLALGLGLGFGGRLWVGVGVRVWGLRAARCLADGAWNDREIQGGIGRYRSYRRAWQMAAYWARFLTHTSMAKSEGMPLAGSIWRTFLHLAKRAPCAYAW